MTTIPAWLTYQPDDCRKAGHRVQVEFDPRWSGYILYHSTLSTLIPEVIKLSVNLVEDKHAKQDEILKEIYNRFHYQSNQNLFGVAVTQANIDNTYKYLAMDTNPNFEVATIQSLTPEQAIEWLEKKGIKVEY